MRKINNGILVLAAVLICGVAFGYNDSEGDHYGPYSSAMENVVARAADGGVPGFVGPDGRGVSPESSTVNYVNPVFKQWAADYNDYIPARAIDDPYVENPLLDYETDGISAYAGVYLCFRNPWLVTGAVTGDNDDICSLGDLHHSLQMEALVPGDPNYEANAALPYNDPYKIQPGRITLSFSEPIVNGPGPDFAVFENGLISAGDEGSAGEITAELAYVEVSTDGVNFVRFPCVSLTEPKEEFGGTGPYGTIDPSEVYNLAGKHVNGYGASWGTPFNLKDLEGEPLVMDGTVDLANINYVRIVDIPGNGFFMDTASALIDPNTVDPNTGAGGELYPADHEIHDAYFTYASGGADIEAVGVIEQIEGDANSDGAVNYLDLERILANWGKVGYWPQGDFNEDGFVNMHDMNLLGKNWLYDISQ